MKYIFWAVGLIFLIAGCVPAKKQTYLQLEKKASKYPKYEPVRSYVAKDYVYILRPDDIISIKISSATPSEQNFFTVAEERSIRRFPNSEPLLSGFQIDEEGNIELPVVGEVKLAGLSVNQAGDRIKDKVEEYLELPSVNVQLLNFDYTVVGEVNDQGKFQNYDTKITILEALGNAGGFTEFADRQNVKVVRSVNDTTTIAYVNVLEDNLLGSPYYYLRPNDIITVSPLNSKNWRNNNVANIGLIFSGLAALSLLLLRVN
ncbi:MAG: polysaccharide biosynthesis/export family protein [Candidatus Cyclobacteriaceae bacterium M3_2C_046]